MLNSIIHPNSKTTKILHIPIVPEKPTLHVIEEKTSLYRINRINKNAFNPLTASNRICPINPSFEVFCNSFAFLKLIFNSTSNIAFYASFHDFSLHRLCLNRLSPINMCFVESKYACRRDKNMFYDIVISTFPKRGKKKNINRLHDAWGNSFEPLRPFA